MKLEDKAAVKDAEAKPEEIIVANLERVVSPETILNYAVHKYGGRLINSHAVGVTRRHNLGILALLCDYFAYPTPQLFGKEFAEFYETHKNKTETPRASVRNILKAHFARNGSH